jgi:hypothetical protein
MKLKILGCWFNSSWYHPQNKKAPQHCGAFLLSGVKDLTSFLLEVSWLSSSRPFLQRVFSWLCFFLNSVSFYFNCLFDIGY